MGIHAFTASDMRATILTETRRNLWSWAEPIVVDRAGDWYARWLDDPAGVWALARKHARLWRAVIHDQPHSVPDVSEELRHAVVAYGFGCAAVDEVNELVLEELFDIILCRYRASRAATKAFSLVLMSATSCLSALRAAA